MPLAIAASVAAASCYSNRQVIKGWDLVIKMMKKSQNAIFTIPAELAYGDSNTSRFVADALHIYKNLRLLTLLTPEYETYVLLQAFHPMLLSKERLSWVSDKNLCKDGGIFKKYEARVEDGTLIAKIRWSDGFGEEGKQACGDEGAVLSNAPLQTLELLSWKTSHISLMLATIKKS
ncbi:hypothetical protein RJ639_045304 [Escallonia herrerae]|uniref:peptidylprolyl isomerase n=1 Tax=Escallonia herrerae TaxID=1293975 RepID=A0AA88W9H9_9ASTE|nr:hypothetical protein RJ639_045304 [Escallonia herrerae]